MGEVWFAPDDPSLPMPWKGIVDANTGCLYYWNPETNITQFEKPVYWVSSPSLSPLCSSGPFYPPHSMVFDYNLHSQYPNFYPHNQVPAETVINGYTFPTQFPFPNHTHTPTNQPINPQSQSTDCQYHSLTHPPIAHPSYHLPPFATSAYPSESDYGYLSSLPNPSDQPFSCVPYPTSPHNSSYSPITYPHTAPKESIVPPYQLPYAADPILPSALAYTAGGTSCTEKDNVPPSEMKKSLRRNLKMRSHVMMKRKPRSQFPRRRRTQNNVGSKGDLCKASSLVAVNWDSTVPFGKSVDSFSELTILDLVAHNGSISVSSKDAPLVFPGDKKKPFLSVDAVYSQMLGPDEFCNTGRAKVLLRLANFQRIKDNSGGPPLVDWVLQLIDVELARFYFNLSFEKPIMNSGHILAEDEQNAIVIHFCNLVVAIDHFSLVTNFLSSLNPILLSMSFVESPVILEVSVSESYEHGSKHEAGEFDKFMVCSFIVIELIKTLHVAHLAHLQATLSDWNREKNVLSSSKGDFEYDVLLENFIESLLRNSQKLFVNIHGKGMESKCLVNYHWLPSLNWNQVLLIGQKVNFQQGFSSLGNDIVLLNYNLCFSAEMHFLGLIDSFVPAGLATSMLMFSHAWDLQIHKLWTHWITTVNTFTATLSHDLTAEGLMVVLGINSGTIDLVSLMISNGHFTMMVTSCHLIGGAYSYHAWLYFLTIKNQGVHMILIAQESPVQRISLFMLARTSKNRVIALVLEHCNQERSPRNKDKREALDDIGTNAVVMCASLVVKNVTELASLKHKKEALDDIGLGVFVFVSLVVFRHSHITRAVRLTDIVEFPRNSMIENALATFWLCCATSMSSLKEGWAPHLNSLMALWIKTLIGECMIIKLPQCLNIMKIFHQLDGTPWKLMVSMHVKVALQEVNIFYYSFQWAVSLVIIHLSYGFFPFLNECVAHSNTDVANPTIIVCGAKDGHILPWKMDTCNRDFLNFHDLLELEVAHNALEWLTGLLHHDTHLYVSYLLDIPEIIMAWKNTKFGLVFYFNVSISVLDDDLATIQNTLVSVNSTTTLRHAMWEVMLLFHGICYKVLPLSLFELAPQQFYKVKLAKKVILDQATLLNVESAFFCLAEMECLCVKWFFGQVGTGADSRTSKWNCFSDKLRIYGCHDILGGLHVGHEQYLIRSFVLDATALTHLLVNPNDMVVKKGMLTLSSHKLLICALVMKENIVAVVAKYNTVRGKVIVDVVIALNQLPNGSYRYWNAQEAFDFPDKMLCASMKSTENLFHEGPFIVVFTQRLFGYNWRILAVILRHEDMPSFKGGGMIGSWLWTFII